jgi:hypothetical protein
MNSEPWRDPLQELWQRQPVPPAPQQAAERILRAVKATEAEWEGEAAAGERGIFVWGWFLGLKLIDAWRAPQDFAAGEWLLVIVMWVMVLAALLARRRRRQWDRDFETSLLGRIQRGRALLRMRQAWNEINVPAGPVVTVVLALQVYHWASRPVLAAAVTAAIALPLLTWMFLACRRKESARLQQRAALLETMEAELARA